MRIRTFTAETMEGAIAEIRKSMGPDAIIISTWESPRGRGVEVRAAVEEMPGPPENSEGPSSQTLPIDDGLERRLRTELMGEMKSQTAARDSEEIQTPQTPLPFKNTEPEPLDYEVRPDGWVKTGITGLLKAPLGIKVRQQDARSAEPENQQAPINERGAHSAANNEPLLEERTWTDEDLDRPLTFHNLPDPLKSNLIRAAAAMDADNATVALGGALDARLVMDPVPTAPARPVALVGAPGSGKTVTTAKLAARSVLAGKKVCLVTTDSLRAGALAQLQAFADILEIELHTAETAENLNAILDAHPDHAIFIDTPATNPYARGELNDLDDFIKACNLEPVFVAPASGNVDDFVDVAKIFASLGVRRMIATRIDTTRRIGGILAAADAANLALAQVSITPYVAQGLSSINPLSLARLLVEVPSAKANVTPDLKSGKPRKAIR